MPKELITLITTHVLNGALPDDYKHLYRSGVQLAGDKGRDGPDGKRLARPIVVPAALRRFSAVAACAQSKSDFSIPL